ncbi:MAG: LysM peptidoglycan-binding domain-containing protein [Desulfobacterales bacterium]|nr:LysM peptidoglycan-binding domain-containing protein [Desulfobacterales bacterium]
MGVDVLCDIYTVQVDDYLIKIFKERGEISRKDFPYFMNIFKRINPHIKDTDLLQPGQQIYIPLKEILDENLPGQSTGLVTIPFVTTSDIKNVSNENAASYTIKKGDTVSAIVAERFGNFKSNDFRKGLEEFKRLNPHIKDLNLIYQGQIVKLPGNNKIDQPIPALPQIPIIDGLKKEDSTIPGIPSLTGEAPKQFGSPIGKAALLSPLTRASKILNATLRDNGKFYFPRTGTEDFEVDLEKYPLIELKNGKKFIFPINKSVNTDLNFLKSYWNNLSIISMPENPSAENIVRSVIDTFDPQHVKDEVIFNDHGVRVKVKAKWIIDEPSISDMISNYLCITFINSPQEKTPVEIVRYLEQHGLTVKDVLFSEQNQTDMKTTGKESEKNPISFVDLNSYKSFVKDLILAIGYNFEKNVDISFPYAGMQIKAQSNLTTKYDGTPLLIDFESLFGEALSAIKMCGIDIIQIKESDPILNIIKKVLTSMKLPYSDKPIFPATQRTLVHNTYISIPGIKISNMDKSDFNMPETLIVDTSLHYDIVQFFKNQNIKIVMINLPKEQSYLFGSTQDINS